MSQSKATPGPWEYRYGCVYARLPGKPAHAPYTRLLLADRANPDTTPAERDRNVELAAQAPAMLAALRLAHQIALDGELPAASVCREIAAVCTAAIEAAERAAGE